MTQDSNNPASHRTTLEITNENGKEKVDTNQLTSINACFVYCAHTTRTTPAMVHDLFCMTFDVEDAKDLPASKFEAAMEWFADFDPKRLVQ